MEQHKRTDPNSNDISLKGLFIKIGHLLNYLKSKWLTLLLFGLLGGALGLMYSIVKKPLYTATCSFVLDDGSKTSSLSQYAGLASLAGIDLGGGASGGVFQGDNILELYRSRTMIEKTLLCKFDYNGHQEMLIDRYIDFNKLRDKWKGESFQNINFNGDPAHFNRKQDSLITEFVNQINKDLLSVTKPDKKLTIINVSLSSKDEPFSMAFTNNLVENVNNFYVQTKTKKTLQNVHILQHQMDSVRSILNSSIQGVASAMDAAPNANPAMLTLRVPSQRKQVDVQASSAVYAEVVKNYELAQMALREETPLIQVIDRPVFPLLIDRVTKFKGILIGLIIGVFVTAIFLTGKKIVSELV